MEQNKLNQSTFREDDSLMSSVALQILSKYGLEENNEQLDKKLFDEGGEVNEWIILKSALQIRNSKPKSDTLSFLIERLKISQNTAENIIEDIKTILLPTLIKEGAVKQEEPKNSMQPQNDVKKIEAVPPTKQKKKSFGSKQKPPQNQPKKNNIKKTSDAYREPIE